ncbi:BTB/POZ protein [Pilobolus umbonatus]|nr:BTB/POZ protein [Pilobolus umbonatus]
MYGTLLTDNRGKPTHNSLPAMERMHTSTMDAPDSIGRKEDSDKFEIEIDQWSKLVKSYKRNKEVLEKTILDQLAALKRLDEDYESANANLYHKIEITYNQLKSGVHHQQPSTTEDRIRDMRKCQEEKIKLNVGGQIYETSLSTLRKDPNSWLASIFSDTSQLLADSNHSYFIDRDGTHFRIILNYLRDLKIPPSVTENPRVMDELMQEARYYQLNGLLKLKWDKLPSISQGNRKKRIMSIIFNIKRER